MIITVTEEDLNNAILALSPNVYNGLCRDCIISQAIKRQIPNLAMVYTGITKAGLYEETNKEPRVYKLSGNAIKIRGLFDAIVIAQKPEKINKLTKLLPCEIELKS